MTDRIPPGGASRQALLRASAAFVEDTGAGSRAGDAAAQDAVFATGADGPVPVSFTLNGEATAVAVDPAARCSTTCARRRT